MIQDVENKKKLFKYRMIKYVILSFKLNVMYIYLFQITFVFLGDYYTFYILYFHISNSKAIFFQMKSEIAF